MLHTVGGLIGSRVIGTEGVIGHVLDAFFDEQSWRICYLLVEVSCVGRDRAVLFPPEAIVSIDTEDGIHIDHVPSFDLKSAERLRSLRSTREVLDCTVAGWAGDIGRTQDVLFDEGSWALRFLMIDVSSWCPGVVVFIRSDLVQEAQWESQSLRVAVTRLEVMNMPNGESTEDDIAQTGPVLH
jgi:uncharacterized protein YrrD